MNCTASRIFRPLLAASILFGASFSAAADELRIGFIAPKTGIYWLFGLVMGGLWFSSLVVYGAAATRMADLGPVLGWPLFMSASIRLVSGCSMTVFPETPARS